MFVSIKANIVLVGTNKGNRKQEASRDFLMRSLEQENHWIHKADLQLSFKYHSAWKIDNRINTVSPIVHILAKS